MKIKFLHFYSAVLSFILVLIGFPGCSDDIDGGGRVEYGVPSAKYKIKGSVVSKEDQSALPRIRVVMVEKNKDREPFYGDTVYTSSMGEFNVELQTFPLDKVTFQIKVDDVDGDQNGSFDSTIEEVIFDKPSFTGGGEWYKGETEKDLGKIEITSQKGKE